MRAFAAVDAVEEAGGRVEGGDVEGRLYALDGLCGSARRHVQVRALSLQLGLARANCVLGSFSDSGVARGNVVFDAPFQPVHVIGVFVEAVMGVLR